MSDTKYLQVITEPSEISNQSTSNGNTWVPAINLSEVHEASAGPSGARHDPNTLKADAGGSL